MTSDELEQRLRARFRAEIGEREPAPPTLYASLAGIPETMPAPVSGFGGPRGFLLLAAAALLLTLIGASIAIGSGLLPPPWTIDEEAPAVVDERPAQSPTARPSATLAAESSAAPSPTPGPARTYACPDMDVLAERLGAVTGPGWPNPPDPATEPGPGAIAGWDDRGADLVLIDPRTGTETPVLDGVPADRPHGLAGSPNGQTLAIAWCELFVMVDGELHRPRPGLQATEIFQWSPDSSRIAMLTFQGAEEFLVIVRQDAAPPIVDLGSPCEGCRIVSDPLWSPNGSQLAVHYQDRDGTSAGVAFIDPDGGGWMLRPASLVDPMISGWLDDAHLVALVRGSGTNAEGDAIHWVSIPADASDDVGPLDLEGDPAAEVWARHESATTRGLLFAPDRSLIAIVSRGAGGALAPYEVTIAHLASGDERVVWSGEPSEGAWPVWSPDSSAVAITTFTYSATSQGVWVVNADGSDPRRVRDEPFQLISWQAALIRRDG